MKAAWNFVLQISVDPQTMTKMFSSAEAVHSNPFADNSIVAVLPSDCAISFLFSNDQFYRHDPF
jgi:hypothetical protein